jgi:hypothetical protein
LTLVTASAILKSGTGQDEYNIDRPNRKVNVNIELIKAPHQDHGKWKMVVDGVELTRVE